MPKRKRGSHKFGRRRPVVRRHRAVRRRRAAPARNRKKIRRLRSNLEVKTQQHAVRSDNLGFHAGSDAFGPSNSLCLLAGLFGGNNINAASVSTGLIPGTGCTDIIGCYSTPAYPSSMKLDIDYKTLEYVVDEAFPNPNLRVLHGFYKNTGDKMSADLTNNATWIDSIRVALLKELFDSDYTADYLAYTQKSRNIKILSDRVIRPKRSVSSFVPQGFDPAGQVEALGVGIVAPNTHLSFKWPHSKHKTRLHLTHQAESDPAIERMVPHNQWIPFLLCLVPGLPSAAYGHLTVRSVTKAYFNDA